MPAAQTEKDPRQNTQKNTAAEKRASVNYGGIQQRKKCQDENDLIHFDAGAKRKQRKDRAKSRKVHLRQYV